MLCTRHRLPGKELDVGLNVRLGLKIFQWNELSGLNFVPGKSFITKNN